MNAISQFFSSFSCFSASSKKKTTTKATDTFEKNQKDIDKRYEKEVEQLKTDLILKTRRVSEQSEDGKNYGSLAKSSALMVRVPNNTRENSFTDESTF